MKFKCQNVSVLLVYVVCVLPLFWHAGCNSKDRSTTSDNSRDSKAALPESKISLARWKTESELIESVSTIELVEMEFELESVKFKIQLPEGSKIAYDIDELHIKFPSKISTTFSFGSHDWDWMKKAYVGDFANVSNQMVGTDLLVTELDDSDAKGFVLHANHLAGGFDLSAKVMNREDDNNFACSIADAALALRCMRTISPVKPMPAQENHAAWFKAVGAKLKTDADGDVVELSLWDVPTGPTILKQVGQLKKLRTLSIKLDHVENKRLSVLANCPELRKLTIAKSILSRIDDVALANVARIPKLERLSADTHSVTAEGFKPLNKLTNLRELLLSDLNDKNARGLSALTNANLEMLYLDKYSSWKPEELSFQSKLSNLTKLIIEGQLNDEAIQALRPTKLLSNLDFRELAISDEGLDHLMTFKNVTSLNLVGHFNKPKSTVTSKGLSQLGSLEKLEYLGIGRLAFGDDALEAFSNHPKIDVLEFYEVQLTKKAFEAFKKAHPNKTVRCRF